MKVEEFFSRIKSDASYGAKSRILIIRNRIEQKELRKLFEERPNQFGWVRFSKCIPSGPFVPPADRVFADIRAAISELNSIGKMAYVTGLSAMLAVWDYAQKTAAFEQLRDLLDDGSLRFLAFVNCLSDEMKSAFLHPRYKEGNSIIAVGEKPDEGRMPEIRMATAEICCFLDGSRVNSLSSYINEYEMGLLSSQPVNIQMTDYSQRLACVSDSVRQIFTVGEYMRLFCNYQGGLSEGAAQWLFTRMRDDGKVQGVKDFAQKLFFQGNMTHLCRDAPRTIIGCNGEEREVLLWLLERSLQINSYLYKVLHAQDFDAEQFKTFYVNEAIELIGGVDEAAMCAERREGIAEMMRDGTISLDAEIADFIEKTKNVDSNQIVPWLTNQTRREQQECVRRLRYADINTLSRGFYDAYPILEHYMAPYALGNAELEEYFTEYRALKMADTVTEEFCQKAKDIQYPMIGVKSRDDLLNMPVDSDAALLVVDAMGVEYLPMILSLSKRMGLGVANAVPALVKLPSSTKFNPIAWPAERMLNGIHELDIIIHNGAHMHGASTSEENFIAMLDVFSKLVMPAVATALARHKKVILTADHGASRLAVLANKQQLAKTLPVKGVADSTADWRYIDADPNSVSPQGVASSISGAFWVAKGYDRFSKRGGKLNELHGGLTREEALVPFVVFEKGATFTPLAIRKAEQPQFEENTDFDL